MKSILQLFLVVLLMCVCTVITYSQQMEDVIYLKNGSIIHGIIIEQTPNVSIKIKTREGNILAYKYEDIENSPKKKLLALCMEIIVSKRSESMDLKKRNSSSV